MSSNLKLVLEVDQMNDISNKLETNYPIKEESTVDNILQAFKIHMVQMGIPPEVVNNSIHFQEDEGENLSPEEDEESPMENPFAHGRNNTATSERGNNNTSDSQPPKEDSDFTMQDYWRVLEQNANMVQRFRKLDEQVLQRVGDKPSQEAFLQELNSNGEFLQRVFYMYLYNIVFPDSGSGSGEGGQQ